LWCWSTRRFPAKTIKEFIALAKQEPGKINFASAGSGSGIHLGTELLAFMAGIKMTHIPYKGSAPALTDLVGGHVSLYFSSLPPAIGLVKDGKVRALAVTGPTRSKVFPDLRPSRKLRCRASRPCCITAIVAPAGTPRPIIDKLNAAMRAALASPDVQARIDTDGAEPMASTPEQYAADIDREETKWSEIVRRSGAKAE